MISIHQIYSSASQQVFVVRKPFSKPNASLQLGSSTQSTHIHTERADLFSFPHTLTIPNYCFVVDNAQGGRSAQGSRSHPCGKAQSVHGATVLVLCWSEDDRWSIHATLSQTTNGSAKCSTSYSEEESDDRQQRRTALNGRVGVISPLTCLRLCVLYGCCRNTICC